MFSFNKVIIVGNLTKDPELRYNPSGKAVTTLSLAVNSRARSKGEKNSDDVSFFDVVVWEKQAETCGQYLSKGRQVFVEGRITNRSYDDKDGNKRYISEIVARDVRFLGGGGQGTREAGFVPPPGEDQSIPADSGGGDDDIPF